jgi:HTH-type transcriptional regulator, glycine betaine synthesis regulator
MGEPHRSRAESLQFAQRLQKELNHSNGSKRLVCRIGRATPPFTALSEPTTVNAVATVDAAEPTHHNGVLSDVQLDIIDICVRASQAVGIPRSIGEIFGLIFTSPKPVNFDDVVRSLGISSGSASHGLRKMCRLGIIRTCYVARDRRDHYTFETSFRNLVLALLEENLLVHVCWADEQIERLRSRVNDDATVHQNLTSRIDLLSDWSVQVRGAMKLVSEVLK